MEYLKTHPGEITGIVVAILALLIGIWHVREIRQVLAKARAQREVAAAQIAALQNIKDTATIQISELQNIKESLSTRYIGLFPEYCPDIAKLIESASREIIIVCDFPCYGGFSNRKHWLSYKHALERKSVDGVKIYLTCFNEVLRNRVLQDQFFTANDVWEKWKETAANKKRLEVLLAHHHGETIEKLTKERFLEILEDEEKDALGDVFLNAEVTQISVATPFYLWLIDEKRAIFAIASLGEEEYGFSTIDQQLIKAFLKMRELHLKETGRGQLAISDSTSPDRNGAERQNQPSTATDSGQKPKPPEQAEEKGRKPRDSPSDAG